MGAGWRAACSSTYTRSLCVAWVALSASAAAYETPIDPATPPRLAQHRDVQPLLAGFVDPMLPPYSAAGDGVTDDAAALQSAIDDAYSARMTVVLHPGRVFLLSTQLRFVQPPNVTGRSYGYAMVGARGSPAVARPMLKLADHADTSGWVDMPHNGTEPNGGQGNCAPSQQDCVPKVLLLFQYLETRSTSRDTIRAETFYLARLRGVDIDLGSNPGVSGVSMSSAQLASIEDVRVIGTSFHAGFNGLPGSGGFSANLEVEGGDYGVVQNQFRPNPSITGLRLVGQTIAGVVVDVSRGPVVISGFTIQGPRNLSPALSRAYLLRIAHKCATYIHREFHTKSTYNSYIYSCTMRLQSFQKKLWTHLELVGNPNRDSEFQAKKIGKIAIASCFFTEQVPCHAATESVGGEGQRVERRGWLDFLARC